MNTFQKFYEKELNEMPHGFVGNEPVDFKLEKIGWEYRFYNLIRRTSKEHIDQLLKPFYDLGYKRMLKRKFEQLDDEKKQMLLKILPNKFVQDMNLINEGK